MKSGGPWNLRGLLPETRAAAREAARRSGLSVGEWLNTVVQPVDEDDDGWWSSDYDREPRDRHQPRPRYEEYDRDPYRDPPPREREPERERYHQAPPPWRRRARYENEYDDEPPVRRRARRAPEDYAPLGGPYRGEPQAPDRPRRERPRHDAPPAGAPVEDAGEASIDHAVAEIAARQRALDDAAAAEIKTRQRAVDDDVPPQHSFSEREPQPLPPRPEPSYPTHYAGEPLDLSLLEQQLREITARIETLQPAGDLQTAIAGLQTDLAAIGHTLDEALPRRALESLEIEVKALAQRIDHTRQSGIDAAALSGIEHGLDEVRESLHKLTPAESLVGFQQAVNKLSQKVDAIVARDDPAALQQLETAIGGLRGIVSHVASNDTLTKVAEDVRALATKVDGLAMSATGLPALTALENRIDTLAGAINASTEAGHAVPRELEKLLSGLIEKLEWVQLTHTDHTALAHLEDRIASLVKRLDVSDARLGLLEGVERGLADLLVYIEQLRGGAGAPAAVNAAPADAVTHGVAENKQTERSAQTKIEDSLEEVQGTVEHVVDRLAMIESGIRGDKPKAAVAEPANDSVPEPLEIPSVQLEPRALPEDTDEALFAAEVAAQPEPDAPQPEPQPVSPSQRLARTRMPIDPSLPPDHPLEPGSAARTRTSPSAAERIAASEAAVGAKPPVIPDPGGGKPDFIAAARRAAKAAAVTAADDKAGRKITATGPAPAKKLGEKLRTLAVAGAVVVIIVGGFHIVSRLFEDGGASAPPSAKSEPPRILTEPLQRSEPKPLPPEPPQVQVEPQAPPAAAPEGNAPTPPMVIAPPADADTPQSPSAPLPGATPAPATGHTDQQSSLTPSADLPVGAAPDITGSLPKTSAKRGAAGAPVGPSGEKLPVAIGGPMLRNAALAGDPLAAYEVAARFAEGRLVPVNNEEAARWFDIAAKKGLAPAQFRLATLYEKGLGVRKDLAAARDLYRSAAEKGHGKAMHNLAVLYAEGVDGKSDYRAAAQWFRKAADRGVADSQYNLAVLYARGVGVERNFAESYKWFFLAARDGDTDAAQKRDEIAARLDAKALEAARRAAEKWAPIPQPPEVITVKGAWDMPGNGTPAAKPKPRTSAKAPAPDAAKVN